MQTLKVVPLFCLMLFPLGANALSPDFASMAPKCEIEGQVLSVVQEEAEIDETWADLSRPARYTLEVRVLALKNAYLDNGYERTCRSFYEIGKVATFSIPLVDTQKLGVPEEGLYITGTVRAMVAEVRLKDYTLSTQRDEDILARLYPYIALVVVASLAAWVGFLFGRRRWR